MHHRPVRASAASPSESRSSPSQEHDERQPGSQTPSSSSSAAAPSAVRSVSHSGSRRAADIAKLQVLVADRGNASPHSDGDDASSDDAAAARPSASHHAAQYASASHHAAALNVSGGRHSHINVTHIQSAAQTPLLIKDAATQVPGPGRDTKHLGIVSSSNSDTDMPCGKDAPLAPLPPAVQPAFALAQPALASTVAPRLPSAPVLLGSAQHCAQAALGAYSVAARLPLVLLEKNQSQSNINGVSVYQGFMRRMSNDQRTVGDCVVQIAQEKDVLHIEIRESISTPQGKQSQRIAGISRFFRDRGQFQFENIQTSSEASFNYTR